MTKQQFLEAYTFLEQNLRVLILGTRSSEYIKTKDANRDTALVVRTLAALAAFRRFAESAGYKKNAFSSEYLRPLSGALGFTDYTFKYAAFAVWFDDNIKNPEVPQSDGVTIQQAINGSKPNSSLEAIFAWAAGSFDSTAEVADMWTLTFHRHMVGRVASKRFNDSTELDSLQREIRRLKMEAIDAGKKNMKQSGFLDFFGQFSDTNVPRARALMPRMSWQKDDFTPIKGVTGFVGVLQPETGTYVLMTESQARSYAASYGKVNAKLGSDMLEHLETSIHLLDQSGSLY